MSDNKQSQWRFYAEPNRSNPMKTISLNRFRSTFMIGLSAIVATAFLVSCDRGPEKSAATGEAAVSVQKVEGGALNAFFPKDEGDFDVVFTSEKVGFAQAKLENDGNELGTLSISDTAGSADVRANYDAASMKVGGFPAITRGSKGTAVLAGRFQVQVRSKSDAFTADDRQAWLEKFDLNGLAKLAR